jgi:hypothetical protein
MYLAEAAHHIWVASICGATNLGMAPAMPPNDMTAVKTRGDVYTACYVPSNHHWLAAASARQRLETKTQTGTVCDLWQCAATNNTTAGQRSLLPFASWIAPG